jgi:D-threo-aldose 1-dehydrogenase
MGPSTPIFPGTAQGLPLGLGGAPLGNLFEAVSTAQATALLTAALEDGCASFDTAPHYGQGLSEHRMGQILRARDREGFCISSKVGRILRPDPAAVADQNGYRQCLPFSQHWDFSVQGTRRSVEDSLQRLGLARLDTAFVHDCDATTHGERYPAVLQQVVQETLPALHQLRREGYLRHIGLGVNDVQVCLDVIRQAPRDVTIDCLLLAGRYSLIDHSALAELLPLCVERDIRVALGGVFNSGILATGVRGGAEARFNYAAASPEWIERVDAVQGVCEDFDVPLRAAALQFVSAHPAIEVIVLGARQAAEWQDAVHMLRHPIPFAFWQALRQAGLLPPDAPLPAADS